MEVETYGVGDLTTDEPLAFEDDGAVIVRNPYRRMTVEEFRVYDQLFASKTEVSRYGAASIPLRVLQVAAHATTVQEFNKLEVWHPTSSSLDRDPVLVAIASDPDHSWLEEQWILARWGETLVPFEELKERAVRMLATEARATAERLKAFASGVLETLESTVPAYLGGRGEHPLHGAPDVR